MALIKCKECGRDVSDKAVSCPHCGSPIGETVTVQLTGKRWKVLSLVGGLMLAIGFVISIFSAGSAIQLGIGINLAFLGLAFWLVARIGAWWQNR